LIFALKVSLSQILAEGMEARFVRHKTLSRTCKAGLAALGLSQVPVKPEYTAHTLSCPRYPANINGAEFLGNAAKAGVTLAGGLYPTIRSEYFRIGHMGAVNLRDILVTLEAIEAGLRMCGYQTQPGNAIAAAHKAYLESSE
jgi:alanine-glyoxylate transaminase/serine-glyoxylate transaminase/serine-pyruvate transaminase